MTDTIQPSITPATGTPTPPQPAPAGAGSLGALKTQLDQNETVAKAKAFAKERPWATAALAGVVGMAILNTLRGRR